MGFVLVLMPLGGMIWHDSQALSHLGQLTSDEYNFSVVIYEDVLHYCQYPAFEIHIVSEFFLIVQYFKSSVL